MITCIVSSHNAQLSQTSSEVPDSSERQKLGDMAETLNENTQIDADIVYMPFARQILATRGTATLALVKDGSQAGRGCMMLMVGMFYKKRALPIAWVVYKGEKGHTTAQPHIKNAIP